MSLMGTKRTCGSAPHMSALGGKADMTFCGCKCPLVTQSGHRRPSLIDFERLTSSLASLRRVTCVGEISSK